MSQEAVEAKLVQKTVSILRMARHVIGKLHDENEKGFQEEPSLSDLVLVAQIIGQTSTIDRLGEIGGQGDIPPGAESPARAVISGEIQLPDLFVMWTPEGWYVNANPDFQIQSQHCRTKEELSSILQQLAEVCASHRIS